MIRSFRSLGRAERMTSFGSRVILGKEGARFFSATLPSPHVNPPGVQVNSDAWWLLQFVFDLFLSFSPEPLALGAGGFRAVATTSLGAVSASAVATTTSLGPVTTSAVASATGFGAVSASAVATTTSLGAVTAAAVATTASVAASAVATTASFGASAVATTASFGTSAVATATS